MKHFLRLTCISAMLLLLQGCVSIQDLRNTPSAGVSRFDNTEFIAMKNINCGDIELELYQDTNKAKIDKVLLTAGTRDIENIGRGKSLLFKLDGTTYSFQATSVVTEHDKIGLNMSADIDYSNKKYVVPESFIKKFAKAEDVRAKLYLLNNTFVEGFCSPRTYEDYYREAKPEHRVWLTQKGVDSYSEVAATKGFAKFVQTMDQAF